MTRRKQKNQSPWGWWWKSWDLEIFLFSVSWNAVETFLFSVLGMRYTVAENLPLRFRCWPEAKRSGVPDNCTALLLLNNGRAVHMKFVKPMSRLSLRYWCGRKTQHKHLVTATTMSLFKIIPPWMNTPGAKKRKYLSAINSPHYRLQGFQFDRARVLGDVSKNRKLAAAKQRFTLIIQ